MAVLVQFESDALDESVLEIWLIALNANIEVTSDSKDFFPLASDLQTTRHALIESVS